MLHEDDLSDPAVLAYVLVYTGAQRVFRGPPLICRSLGGDADTFELHACSADAIGFHEEQFNLALEWP
ncbi:MAG: hypothetical protein ACYC3I_18545 [Gemmataceae bacterium]